MAFAASPGLVVRSSAIAQLPRFASHRARRLEPWGRSVLRGARHAMAAFGRASCLRVP